MPRLGVNIDHIATLRQARGGGYPDPFESLTILKHCQVDQVTCHLREDRRHIQDVDLEQILDARLLPVNMEMALTEEMVEIAIRLKPSTVTIVPEKRQEITTEGGLNLADSLIHLQKNIPRLKSAGIRVSLFIDPDPHAIKMASQLSVDGIEFHTGSYCEAYQKGEWQEEYNRLRDATRTATASGLKIFAGHGLNWKNLAPLMAIREIEEYNVGHSIIARAIFLGLEKAIQEIQGILKCTSQNPI